MKTFFRTALVLIFFQVVHSATYFTDLLPIPTVSAVNSFGGAGAWVNISNIVDDDTQNAATQINAGVFPADINITYSSGLLFGQVAVKINYFCLQIRASEWF